MPVIFLLIIRSFRTFFSSMENEILHQKMYDVVGKVLGKAEKIAIFHYLLEKYRKWPVIFLLIIRSIRTFFSLIENKILHQNMYNFY